MGDLAYTQTIQILAAKYLPTGALSSQKDFEQNPPETWTTNIFSEDFGGRYNVPATTLSLFPGMGTVQSAKIFVIQPDTDVQVRFTNALGMSPFLTFQGGRISVCHIEFTNIEFGNPTAVIVKGRFFVAGD